MSENQGTGNPMSVAVADISVQDLVRERRAERKLKAEQKRQVDLQRIRDMRSKTGIDPLQRFPKEIWMQILDDLSPEDLANVWQMHPMFRDLLESTRNQNILLPQLFKIDQFRRDVQDENFFGARFKDQSGLRRISKATRKSFDLLMDQRLAKRVHKDEAGNPRYIEDEVRLHINGRDELKILKQSLASFDGSENSAKHFFQRGLSVSFSEAGYGLDLDEPNHPANIIDSYKRDVTTLLERIGHQIWRFRFSVEDLLTINLSFSDVYTIFHKWVSLMPNLKWMEVRMRMRIRPSYAMVDLDDLSEDRVSLAKSLIQKHPIPRLAHLERLSFHSPIQPGEMGAFHLIYEAVLGANLHIKRLDLPNSNLDVHEPDSRILPAYITQSTELSLTGLTVTGELSFHEEEVPTFQRLQASVNCNWPLQTIIFALRSNQAQMSDNSVSSVFRFLEQFPTLEKVKLNDLEGFSIGNVSTYLKLPNLTDFDLKLTDPQIEYDNNICTPFFFSIQFLANCKNLKTICWRLVGFDDCKLRRRLRQYERKNFGKVLDFRSGLRFLYDSNIWDVFPSLNGVFVAAEKRRGQGGIGCIQEYRREEIEEDMPAADFIDNHNCSSDLLYDDDDKDDNGESLANCVMLAV